MRPMMVKAVAAAAGLALLASACGDDDDDAATPSEQQGEETPAEGDTAAFCDAVLEFYSLANETQLDESTAEADIVAAGEQLGPVFQELVDNAPESVADTAQQLNEDAVQPLLDGDASGFNDEATYDAYIGMVDQSADECEFPRVPITATDYAFAGVPETIDAGTYVFELTNEGSEEHEMVIFRKAEGVTESFEELVNLPEEEGEEKIVFAGAGFAPPGESGAALTQLEPGEYAMVCFIPVGGGEDGPPHFTQGMLTDFTVE